MVKTSMTEAEAIEVIHKAMEFSISAIAELDKTKEKIDMVGLAGEYYENKENCEREIAACMLAINALKEIQEYRAIGTVEEIKEILQLISEGQEDVDESGISTGLLHTLLEYGQYKKIGTVKECQEARERQRAKKVKNRKLLRDFHNIPYSVRGDCPNCGSIGLLSTNTDHCNACGQKLDWSRDGRYQDGVRKIQSD